MLICLQVVMPNKPNLKLDVAIPTRLTSGICLTYLLTTHTLTLITLRSLSVL